MAIERPDWNFDNSGNLPVPATPPHEQLVSDIAAYDGPTGAAVSTPAAPVPTKSKGFSGLPDWGDKPRNESGQFVSKSESENRAHWEKEGGIAQVMQTAMRKEAAMLSVAPSIEAKIATLDRGFLTKAVDHLRLSPSYGPDGFWRSVKQFEDSLSASERETWAKF